MPSHHERASHAAPAPPPRMPDRAQPVASVWPVAPELMTQRDVVTLQSTAGNRATTSALRSGTIARRAARDRGEAVQRDGARSRPFDPGPLVLQPADKGQPPEAMSSEDLKDAIHEHQTYIDEQTSSTPEVRRREERLAVLLAAQRRLGERAAVAGTARDPLKAAKRKRKGKGRDTVPMPARPESLDHSIDVTRLPPQRIREELDRVVAYLAAGPSKAEREVLEIELPFLEEAAGKERTKAEATERGERMSKALTPTSGNEESQFMELLRRVQGAERVSQDVWLLHYDNKVFPIDPRELVDLRQKVGAGLTSGARAVDGAMYDVEGAWKERHQKAREHKVVHRLARFTSGVDEISATDIENMISVAGMYTRRVSTAGQGGSLVYAGEQLLVFDAYAKYWANKVGEWESGLMHGAGNWAIALTIVKEALTIWAGIGAAKLASAAGGGFLGAMQAGAKITAVTTGTGMVAGGVGAAITGNDVTTGVRLGGGAGFGVGANALTAGVGRLGTVADAAKATGAARKAYAVGKAVVLETGANVATGTAKAAIEGGSMGDAAVGALVSTPIGALGGAGVDKIAKGGKAAVTAGKAAVGATAGIAGAVATGGDVLTGALTGGGSAGYGAYATHQPVPVSGGSSGGETVPGGGSGAGSEPVPVPGAGSVPVTTGGSELAPGTLPPTGELAPGTIPAAGETAPGPIPAAGETGIGPAGRTELPTTEDIDAHFAGLDEGALAGHNPDRPTGYQVPVEALGGKQAGASGSETAGPAGSVSTVGTNEPAPGTADPAGTLGTADPVRTVGTADPVGTVGTAAPVAGVAGAGARGVDSDLVREPNRPPSVPTGAAFEPRDSARYRDAGTTSGGTSGARIVVDTTSGRKYVFKPVSNELEVPRAQDRGIQQGEYAPRAKAAELASEALGLKTPAVELVQIGKDRGSLTEWVEMESLADYITRDPAGFADLRRKPEFKAAQDAIDTLDYLINQVDRAQNKGNYLIEFHPDGRFKSLIPIDSELSFTSTRERAKVGAYANDLPATMSPEMVARLERLGRDREAFVESIRPLVGDEAIPGVLERLDALLVWSKGGAAASPAPGASRGASSSRGATSSGGTGKP